MKNKFYSRNLFLLVLLFSCAKSKENPCAESEWTSSTGSNVGQKIILACNNLKYIRPNPPCEIEGTFQHIDDTDETRIAWKLPRTCSADDATTEIAFLTINDDEMELSVPGLGIHAIFDRTK
jgi:hypothetical protein